MIPDHSTIFNYQPAAMCAGQDGSMWNLTITRRSWLANSRKVSAVRPDAIVIG